MTAVSGGSSTVSHTLQRHNDILQDYAQEFNRTKVLQFMYVLIWKSSLSLQANVLAQRQREELLGSARKDRQVICFMSTNSLLRLF